MIQLKDINVRDPFIYAENGTYYLYASGADGKSFVCYKSADMRSFDPPKTLFSSGGGFWATKQFWAPEMHAYNGRYYLFGSLKSDDRPRGTQIFVCDTPDGKFEPLSDAPITPADWECLDGTLYVENCVPYMVFCREWLQIRDGEMYIMRLSPDLKSAEPPVKLFSASSAPWVRPLSADNYVTDGPYIVKENGEYKMLWSSFCETGYGMGVCKAKSLFGPWEHCPTPINTDNGGHGMILSGEDKRYIVYHAPNDPVGSERIKFVPIEL